MIKRRSTKDFSNKSSYKLVHEHVDEKKDDLCPSKNDTRTKFLEHEDDTFQSQQSDFMQITISNFPDEKYDCPKSLDFLHKRAENRSMTACQEVWNALTMLPATFYCLYYVISGAWLSEEDVSFYMDKILLPENQIEFHEKFCITSSMFPKVYSMPPPTLLAIIGGLIIHAPCAILYHLLCAFYIPPGIKRVDHWARRLDQSMIHVMSIFWSYGSSGSINYSFLSILYNIDSIYRIFRKDPQSTHIRIRILLASLLIALPFVARGDMEFLFLFIFIYSVGAWMFASYPFGGWSHGLFHVVFALIPIIVQNRVAKLPINSVYMKQAAECFILRENMNELHNSVQ
mmetsp:Transcript_8722/g.12396  ORF Transcript_8722/g.12396 Transcript_8722/m.12396 type:complete len:343 (-) Transcript_8722:73-1101(-)